MASSVRSIPNPKFNQGETVLCYEPDLSKSRVLYEAKVLEVDVTKDDKGKKVPEYFIHFSGWNKSWDRWVVEDQVLKNTDTNKALKAKLREQACRIHKKRKQRTSSSTSENSPNVDNISNTGKSDSEDTQLLSTCTTEADNIDLPKVEIEIPSQLKLRLEDDCYFIKRKKKLVQLPRNPCVDSILEEYYQYYLETNPGCSGHLVRELMDGLRIYFNFTLPTLLLYNFEREQFKGFIQMGTAESDSYTLSRDQNSVPTEEKCSIVSSTTVENSANVSESNLQKEKEKRTLRRRPLRSNAAQSDQQSIQTSTETIIDEPDPLNQTNQTNPLHNEESQSATVSSTSSSPETFTNKLIIKRKATELEEESETSSEHPTAGLCSPLPLTAALLSASCKRLPSKVYGPEHLLRLFVKLPGLLGRTDMPELNLTSLLDHIDLFLRYLVERSNALFPDDVYQSFL